MDELEPIDDFELMDEIDKAQLTLLYALQEKVDRLGECVERLEAAMKAERVTTMTGRDGKTLKAISRIKE